MIVDQLQSYHDISEVDTSGMDVHLNLIITRELHCLQDEALGQSHRAILGVDIGDIPEFRV